MLCSLVLFPSDLADIIIMHAIETGQSTEIARMLDGRPQSQRMADDGTRGRRTEQSASKDGEELD